jgi:hypothetical protein
MPKPEKSRLGATRFLRGWLRLHQPFWRQLPALHGGCLAGSNLQRWDEVLEHDGECGCSIHKPIECRFLLDRKLRLDVPVEP